MIISVNAIHFSPDQKLVDFATKKTSKLDLFFDGIISGEVILKVEKPEVSNNKVAEVKISIPSADYLFAKKQADSFEEAIDLCVDALKKQLEKFKEKLKEK